MKRSANASILAFVCLVLISSMGCGGSSSKPSTTTVTPTPETFAITATSGSGQSTSSGKPFSAPLVAGVTASGIRTSGIKVTFTAPTTGPSGTFANGTTTDVEISNAAGVVTSSVFTANANAGNFSVTATVSGAPKPVPFALTILAPVATPSFVFSVSGQEIGTPSQGTGAYYALAGVFTVDANGNVIGGEQDFNDAPGGSSFTPAEPTPDTINSKGGSLTVDPATGLGTLTLSTSNALLGVNQDGTETFAVQFVNPKHALIMQFDGFATSSGTLDLQTFPSTLNGGYAFAISGVDTTASPYDVGGVFTVSGTSITNGLYDLNDINDGAAVVGTSLNGTISSPDGFGRGTFTGITNPAFGPMTFAYYIVGPEAIRVIDIDSNPNSNPNGTDSGVGSAFGQGTGTFSTASLGASVFAVAANDAGPFGALGQFTTTSTTSPPAFTGVGDDNEVVNFVQVAAAPISGNYSIQSNGYGNLNLNASFALGNVNLLGIYMTDPTLNLNDPNNPTGGGGALVADLDDGTVTSGLFGGTGVIVPQTTYASSAAASAAFAGQYAMGWQNFNELYNLTGTGFCPATNCEFDMLAQGTLAAGGILNPVTGDVSDPYLTVSPASATSGETTGNTFTGTPLADPSNIGRYTMFSTNATPNQLATVIGGAAGPPFDIVIYQASGGQLFWLGNDVTDPLTFGLPLTVSLGPIEQATLTGLPAARKPAAKAKASRKR